MKLLRDKGYRSPVVGNRTVQLVAVKSSSPAVEASLRDFESILRAVETICETGIARGTEMHLCARVSTVLTLAVLVGSFCPFYRRHLTFRKHHSKTSASRDKADSASCLALMRLDCDKEFLGKG